MEEKNMDEFYKKFIKENIDDAKATIKILNSFLKNFEIRLKSFDKRDRVVSIIGIFNIFLYVNKNLHEDTAKFFEETLEKEVVTKKIQSEANEFL